MSHLPATDNRLNEVKQAQDSDEICNKTVIRYCREGWPQQVKGPIKKFVAVSSELSIHNGLLKGHGLVIPPSMQSNILDSIHAGHQGITKCRQRARISV